MYSPFLHHDPILHSIGIKTRAGLISRVHGIPFHRFKEELFKPLEYIIFSYKDDILFDYVYKTRHSIIARILFDRVLNTQDTKYDELARIITNLDIDYRSDSEAFHKLLNCKNVLNFFHNPDLGRSLFRIAHELESNSAYILQQEALFEMHLREPNLKKTEELLRTAYRLKPWDRTIGHSLAELEYAKSKNAKTEIEKVAFRNKTIKVCEALISEHKMSSFSFHTLLKVHLDRLEDAIISSDYAIIERESREFEKNIKRALQLFPDESFILDIESSYQELMNNNPKAIEALEKAYETNKRSPYISSRLSKLYELNGKSEQAIRILRESTDANPGDKSINLNLALLLLEKDDANQPEILHHLNRSFTRGDNNYMAQFWFARQLFCMNKHDDAKELFDDLRLYQLPMTIKNEPRGIVKGEKKTGVIVSKESTYAFISIYGIKKDSFCHSQFVEELQWEQCNVGDRVIFDLAFNFKGPVCINVEKAKL